MRRNMRLKGMLHLCVPLSQIPATWTRRVRINPNSGKSAPELPSLTRRSSSWSAASTTSGTFLGRNGRTWRPPWSSQRLRSRFGSRTVGTRQNAARWPPIWWLQPRRPRKWRWKFWCGTTRDSTARGRSCGPRCSPFSRPTITPTPTASLHGRSLRARGTSENLVTVFIHLIIFCSQETQNNLTCDKRRRPEGTAQCLWLNFLTVLFRQDSKKLSWLFTSWKTLKRLLHVFSKVPPPGTS